MSGPLQYNDMRTACTLTLITHKMTFIFSMPLILSFISLAAIPPANCPVDAPAMAIKPALYKAFIKISFEIIKTRQLLPHNMPLT